jgi:hypothetical protein
MILLNAILILLIDIPWLYFNRESSARMIQKIQGSALSIRWLPALLVYPALGFLLDQANSLSNAVLIGLATYAVYDLTNFSILKDYTLEFTIMDILWGGVLFALAYSVKKMI